VTTPSAGPVTAAGPVCLKCNERPQKSRGWCGPCHAKQSKLRRKGLATEEPPLPPRSRTPQNGHAAARAEADARRAQYAKLRDDGVPPWEAAEEVGIAYSHAKDNYEPAYRKTRAEQGVILPTRPRRPAQRSGPTKRQREAAERHTAYDELRADGIPIETAAALIGITPGVAERYYEPVRQPTQPTNTNRVWLNLIDTLETT